MYIQCVYFWCVPGPCAVICWGGVQFPPLLNCTRCCPVRRGGCQNYNQRPQQTKRRNLTNSHEMMTAEKKSSIKAAREGRKEGNVLFNDTLNTCYLRLYGVRHMVKDHSDSEKGNLLPPHRLLFPINSKGSFICTIPQTGLHIPRPLLHQSWSTGWND